MDYKKEVAKILDNQIKDFDKKIDLKNNELLKLKEELKELKKEQRKIVKDKNNEYITIKYPNIIGIRCRPVYTN